MSVRLNKTQIGIIAEMVESIDQATAGLANLQSADLRFSVDEHIAVRIQRTLTGEYLVDIENHMPDSGLGHP